MNVNHSVKSVWLTGYSNSLLLPLHRYFILKKYKYKYEYRIDLYDYADNDYKFQVLIYTSI